MAGQAGHAENFDELYNGNNAFVLGGTTFHWVPLHWREWGEHLDKAAADEIKEQKKHEDQLKRLMETKNLSQIEAEEELERKTTVVSSFEALIDRISVYLDPSEVEAFKAHVNDRNKRITVQQLRALQIWLQEVQTPERPTNTPSTSSSGVGTPGATSPAA